MSAGGHDAVFAVNAWKRRLTPLISAPTGMPASSEALIPCMNVRGLLRLRMIELSWVDPRTLALAPGTTTDCASRGQPRASESRTMERCMVGLGAGDVPLARIREPARASSPILGRRQRGRTARASADEIGRASGRGRGE